MIVKLSVHNYKSLRNVQLANIQPFSVIVGANASGKSNFADALDFLSLIFRGGLAHAVRTKGGYENICFRRAQRARGPITFEVQVEEQTSAKNGRPANDPPLKISYRFEFKARTAAIAADYDVTHESLRAVVPGRPYAPFVLERKGKNVRLKYGGKIASRLAFPSRKFVKDWFEERAKILTEDELLIPAYGFLFGDSLAGLLEACRVYQIAPHMARESGVPERSPELNRHGRNLPAAVDYLARMHPSAYKELVAHLRHIVPSMDRLKTDFLETKQLGLVFTESGVGRPWTSQDVSDGTIQAVALYLALLDPRNRVVVIEEPENSIHPWILRHFIDVCAAASTRTQVFLTTHSPVLLDEVPVEALLIAVRHGGETNVFRAVDKYPEANEVAKGSILGLGSYWDSGAVGGVPDPSLLGSGQ